MSILNERLSTIFFEGKEDRQEIPFNWGDTTKVSKIEAAMARVLFEKLKVEELVEAELGITPETMDKILSGEYHPYTGGMLKPSSMSGPNPKYATDNRHARFYYGVLALAISYFKAEELDIFCRMVSITSRKLKLVAKHTGDGHALNRHYNKFREDLLLSYEETCT